MSGYDRAMLKEELGQVRKLLVNAKLSTQYLKDTRAKLKEALKDLEEEEEEEEEERKSDKKKKLSIKSNGTAPSNCFYDEVAKSWKHSGAPTEDDSSKRYRLIDKISKILATIENLKVTDAEKKCFRSVCLQLKTYHYYSIDQLTGWLKRGLGKGTKYANGAGGALFTAMRKYALVVGEKKDVSIKKLKAAGIKSEYLVNENGEPIE